MIKESSDDPNRLLAQSVAHALPIEQAKYLNNNIPAAVVGLLLNSVFVNSAAFWGHSNPWIMILLGGIVAVCIMRLAVWRYFRGRTIDAGNAHLAIRLNLYAVSAIALIKSTFIWLALPTAHPMQQLVCICTVLFHNVACVFNLAVHYRSFIYGVLPLSLAILVSTYLGHTFFDSLLTLAFLAFFISFYAFSYRFHRFFLQSLHLRFSNLDLVAQLTAQKETAETANLAKSRFLAAASHDLRQPMHALNLYLDSLACHPFPLPFRSTLDKAIQCAHSMNGMFRALLDISRLDADVVQPQIVAFPLTALLENVRIQFEPEAQARDLTLRVRSCEAYVRGDSAMLERILSNLVTNALRYTKQGGVLVGCRKRGTMLRISVYDTGPGIPSAKQRAIFEEFYQLEHPERAQTKGLGLGLAIVERLAKLMSAPITLYSRVGRGSVFSIDLPLAKKAVSPSLLPLASKPIADLTDKLIVLVEDDAVVLDATAAFLRQWGCEVISASSAAQAIKRATQSTIVPDILICDHQLADDETGIEVINKLREEFNEDIPAILITGDTAYDEIRSFKRHDFPVLHKPLEPALLHRALLTIVKRQSRRAN